MKFDEIISMLEASIYPTQVAAREHLLNLRTALDPIRNFLMAIESQRVSQQLPPLDPQKTLLHCKVPAPVNRDANVRLCDLQAIMRYIE